MGAKAEGGRRRVDTTLALKALTAADDGIVVTMGDGMTGTVRAGVDGRISVHVSWRYRFAGKVREVRLGTWRDGPDGVSLKALRELREAMAVDVREGVDPIEKARLERAKVAADLEARQAAERERRRAIADAEKQRIRERAEAERLAAQQAAAAARRVTVRKLFEQWQAVELAPRQLANGTRTGRKDGGEWVRQSFERRVFPAIGDMAVEDVRKSDLWAILDAAKIEGRRRTANVLLADMSQMFKFAAERDMIPANPLQGIKREKVGGKDVERDRVLVSADGGDDELRALSRVLPTAGLAPRSRIAVWLILATACRVGEAMGARWEHVDLDRRRWYLPETKNERDHTIHLSDFALEQFKVLAELRELCPDGSVSPWVFPATDPTKPVCIKSFGKQLADRQREPERRMSGRSKATQALALPGGRWTAHDLRRTAATVMARLGVSGDVIDECLNHKLQSRVARIYIRDRRLADQARAFDALGAYLHSIATGRAGASNVVPLPVRAA